MKMVRLDKYDELQKDFAEYRRLTQDLSDEKDLKIDELKARLLSTNKLVLKQGFQLKDLRNNLTYKDFTFRELFSLIIKKIIKK